MTRSIYFAHRETGKGPRHRRNWAAEVPRGAWRVCGDASVGTSYASQLCEISALSRSARSATLRRGQERDLIQAENVRRHPSRALDSAHIDNLTSTSAQGLAA